MEIKLQAKDLHLDIIAKSWKTVLYNLCLISAGSLIFVIGMNSVLIPSKLLSAGVTGMALIFHYLFPKLNVGLAYFLLNIPLMLLGFFSISRRFLLYTLYGMGFFPWPPLLSGHPLPSSRTLSSPPCLPASSVEQELESFCDPSVQQVALTSWQCT